MGCLMGLSIDQAIVIQQNQMRGFKIILKPKVFKVLQADIDWATKDMINQMKNASPTTNYGIAWKNRESTENGNPKTGYLIPRGSSIQNRLNEIERALLIQKESGDWVNSSEASWDRNKLLAKAIRSKKV
jgi:hypothetical protein